MKLQIALDLDSADKAVAMAAQVYGLVDIIELGTPLMLKEGVGVVGLMKRRFPDALILADMKTADGGYMEARFAVEEGADIVTVLGMAEDETILGVKQATHEAGRLVYVDMLAATDLAARARQIDALGVDIIGVHTAYDVQRLGRTPFDDLATLKGAVHGAKVAVAGGVKLETISRAAALGADIAIVGGALTGAADVAAMARRLREAIDAMEQ